MRDRKMYTCEIVESVDELGENGENARQHCTLKRGQKCSIEDDINQLFEAIEIRKSVGGMGRQESKDRFQKSAMKKPIKAGHSQASGIGISEPVSLKQALRGLCISQASEMAAMKRLSRPIGSPGMSEAGTIKKLYRTVVVDASNSSLSLNEGKGNLLEISLVPERSISKFTENAPESQQVPKAEMSKMPPQDDAGCEISKAESKNTEELKPTDSSLRTHHNEKPLEFGENFPSSIEVLFKSIRPNKEQKSIFHSEASLSSFNAGNKAIKSTSMKPSLINFRNKNFVKKKDKQDSAAASSSSSHCNGEEVDSDVGPTLSSSVSETPNCNLKNRSKEKENSSPASSSTNCSFGTKTVVTKTDERLISREKGEFSHSSKSSIGEYSNSPSVSDESNLSGSSRSGNRPHMSKDLRWEAIHHVQKEHKSLNLRHFKLLNKLGSGDIGTVYLAELNGTNCLFALKVMDNEFLARRKKMARAITEREILQMLDHPFLPTLFAHFTTEKFFCLVMEHCPGGDLHVLRQKQPSKSFSEQATRFYVAEVLLALEYLHMLGVVYRDLKPENVLVREDGHIMLSDFDLSLRCAVHPTLVKSSSSSSSSVVESPKKISSHCTETSCIEPFCLRGPSWQVPCFTPRLLSAAGKSRKLKSDLAAQVSPLPQLVAEPTDARSNSFVGTHEYLAPEIIKGEGHGSAVDWWMFGIFLYELLYGKTPFKGPGNEETLANVVSLNLKFPESPIVSFHARDLIRRLLKKEPENRLGSVKGAAEIKQHPFFEGLNWALIRCTIPPELPRFSEFGNVAKDMSSQNKESTKSQNGFKSTREDLEFEIF